MKSRRTSLGQTRLGRKPGANQVEGVGGGGGHGPRRAAAEQVRPHSPPSARRAGIAAAAAAAPAHKALHTPEARELSEARYCPQPTVWPASPPPELLPAFQSPIGG